MFSCEYWEIFKNNFFMEYLWWLLLSSLLTHYGPVLLFCTPWKHQKTLRFFSNYFKESLSTNTLSQVFISWIALPNIMRTIFLATWMVNPLVSDCPFSDVFRGYRKATLGCNGLSYFWECYPNMHIPPLVEYAVNVLVLSLFTRY